MSRLPDRQNKDGHRSYRRRLMRRAGSLANDQQYRRAIEDFRNNWNNAAPRYLIKIVPTVDELNASPLINRGTYDYAPQRWVEDLLDARDPSLTQSKSKNWMKRVSILCERFFPFEHFGDGVDDRDDFTWRHPAALFVSASIFCPVSEVMESLEEFILEPTLIPHSLPYPPSPIDKLTITRLEGQVRFWRDLALQTIAKDMSVLDRKELLQQADQSGWDYAREQGVSLGFDVPDRNRWWYVPLTPITTANAVRDSAARIAETVRHVYGTQRIDEQIVLMAKQGVALAHISRTLGVGVDMVREAVRNARVDEDAE